MEEILERLGEIETRHHWLEQRVERMCRAIGGCRHLAEESTTANEEHWKLLNYFKNRLRFLEQTLNDPCKGLAGIWDRLKYNSSRIVSIEEILDKVVNLAERTKKKVEGELAADEGEDDIERDRRLVGRGAGAFDSEK